MIGSGPSVSQPRTSAHWDCILRVSLSLPQYDLKDALSQKNPLTHKKHSGRSEEHRIGVGARTGNAQWLHSLIHSRQPRNMCFDTLVLLVPSLQGTGEGWSLLLRARGSSHTVPPHRSPRPQAWTSPTHCDLLSAAALKAGWSAGCSKHRGAQLWHTATLPLWLPPHSPLRQWVGKALPLYWLG